MAAGTGGFGHQRSAPPYRKRKPLPALLLIAVLGVAAAVVWVNALVSTDDISDAIRCRPEATPQSGTTYTPVGHDALADEPPIPPDRVAVRVLNANGTRGQASLTTEAMRQMGFTRVAAPANDPAYPQGEADCHGQIRFGENGAGAARTVQLIDPCLQLVRDNRKDASVDLSIGTRFNLRMSPAATEVLDQLTTWSAEHAATGHNEQSAEQGPEIDEDLLAKTAPTVC